MCTDAMVTDLSFRELRALVQLLLSPIFSATIKKLLSVLLIVACLSIAIVLPFALAAIIFAYLLTRRSQEIAGRNGGSIRTELLAFKHEATFLPQNVN